jgi:glycosyltransferase involved in cell wall biosynthesis
LILKVAILTNFHEFLSGYSLTSIVKTQMKMLVKYQHDVHLYVSEHWNGPQEIPGVTIHSVIPFAHLKDLRDPKDLPDDLIDCRQKTAQIVSSTLQETEMVFTHDWVFQGWNMPFGLGVSDACKNGGLPNTKWLHWIHSTPTIPTIWWDMSLYGGKHRLVFPAMAERTRVAEMYKSNIECVRIIPHIVDLRELFEFDPETCDFIDSYPSIQTAGIVQVYPCSVDRLEAKRLGTVISIFAELKKMGITICLVVATQWATGKKQRDIVKTYKESAMALGLIVDKDIIFTSDYKDLKYGLGLPRKMLAQLQMYSNLFIFPTREESFGLVMPEAILASGCMPVINTSLDVLEEIVGYQTFGFEFGSSTRSVNINNPEKYSHDIALIILGRMMQSESLKTKTRIRGTYNYDAIYRDYYAPIMAESSLWT